MNQTEMTAHKKLEQRKREIEVASLGLDAEELKELGVSLLFQRSLAAGPCMSMITTGQMTTRSPKKKKNLVACSCIR